MSEPRLIRVDNTVDLSEALRANGVAIGRRVVSCVGGAENMTAKDSSALIALIHDHLAPAFERWSVTVVDGGTDSGLMRLLGQARAGISGSFQLVGVAAGGAVRLPDRTPPNDDASDIECNHSHIVLVPGNSWGDETPWLSAVASAVCAGMPSATLVVNGGSITLSDALTSLAADRPIVVLDGSGRSADEIADARAGAPAGERAAEIAASGLTTIVAAKDSEAIVRSLERILAVG